jgi:hypothetical protein
MKISAVNNQRTFNGNVYTLKQLPLKDFDKIQKNAKILINYAKEKPFDYIIFKNGQEKGLSILAKNLEKPARKVLEVLGYPSGNSTMDAKLILKTMKQATEEIDDYNYCIGWSCE